MGVEATHSWSGANHKAHEGSKAKDECGGFLPSQERQGGGHISVRYGKNDSRKEKLREDSVDDRIIGRNKKASFRYELLARFEAGIVLRGSEVKSLRMGRVGFEDAHAVVRNGEVYLRALHIPGYDKAIGGGHDPVSERKLLLKRGEIRKIMMKVDSKGMTLVPTKVYFRNGWAKVEIALATGKRKYDKRQVIQEREQKRELDRFVKQRRQITGK